MHRNIWLLIACLALTAAGVGLDFFSWQNSPTNLIRDMTYSLPSGASSLHVIEQLHQLEVIDQPGYFRILVELEGRAGQLRAGEYLLRQGMTPRELLNQFVTGSVITYNVQIPEGITVARLLKLLNSNANLTPLPDKIDQSNLAAYLGLGIVYAEGFFLPETYQVERFEEVADVLIRAHRQMRAALTREWNMRREGLLLKDKEALLTLASLIEKETGMVEDRARISQVFHKRLSINMRLQTDPTVIYALGAHFDGNLTREDLDTQSPYNTYQVRGLPPSPIALPSIAALKAAAHPADTEFLYFVARGDGTSHFSRTLNEHNSAVRRYQISAK